MSDRATTAWTEFRPRFTMAVISVFGAGVLVGVETGLGRIVLALVIMAAVGASLARDGYLGVVIGLGGAKLGWDLGYCLWISSTLGTFSLPPWVIP